jgi:hypothetical protein
MRNGIGSLVMSVLFMGFLAGSQCHPEPRPQPDGPDAGPDVVVTQTVCERACGRMAELRCPGAGESCVSVCENQETSEVGSFCPHEVSEIKSCEELPAAYEACE